MSKIRGIGPKSKKKKLYQEKKVDKGTASRSLCCIGSNKLLAYQQGERVKVFFFGAGRVRSFRFSEGFGFFEVFWRFRREGVSGLRLDSSGSGRATNERALQGG